MFRVWVLIALVMTAGCVCDGAGPRATPRASCASPVTGQRYALCLESSAAPTAGVVSGRASTGSTGALQNAVTGAHYSLVGGTLHESK